MENISMAVFLSVLVVSFFFGFPWAMSLSDKYEAEKECRMAEAGMEEVVQSLTNSNGKVSYIKLWKKVK